MTKHYYTKGLDIPQDADSVRYPIPEGYTAKIEDGTLILVPKESEDEEIRKHIVTFIMEADRMGEAPEECAKWLAYLEKQKEQKHAPCDLQKAFKDGQESIVTEPEKYGLQKPAEWSEKDEKMMNEIITIMDGGKVTSGTYLSEYAAWLRHLLERFTLQQKQEWSEEDENMMNNIIRVLSTFVGTVECESNPSLSSSYPTYLIEIDWLKSIKNRGNPPKSNTNSPWKPSEEQMGALNYAYCELFKRGDVDHDILGPLQNLIDTLSKL